jgi:ABC-type sugar transport system ATPase subunit
VRGAKNDRIVVMHEGRVEQVDTPFSIYNQPRTRFAASSEILGQSRPALPATPSNVGLSHKISQSITAKQNT